jgi:SAM-dependent methyltransferase
MGRERLEIEFGYYSEWLAEAIAELGLDPIPPSCRGTGNPALFERMADSIRAGPTTRVLDVGCGLGGPGAWLTRARGCDVVGVDVMEGGVHGLKLLFPSALALVASLDALPFSDKTFDAAWALGVIEMIPDKTAALSEVARVIARGGRFGVYGFVASHPVLVDTPSADHFEQPDALTRMLTEAGFEILEAGAIADLQRPPREWTKASEEARDEVRGRHRGDPSLDDVEAEVAKIRRLVRSRDIEAWEFVLQRR